MKLSEKILYCRKKALLSQEALAECVGVSRQAVSKWETGETSPEIGKLLLLAQAFGVTTDWLLSEEEPEAESRPEPEIHSEPVCQPQPIPPESVHTWVDDVPGMLGTLLRRYGWLFGVRLAVSGAVLIAFGIFISLMSNAFFNATSSPFGSSSAIFYDENGNVIRNPEKYYGLDIYDALGMDKGGSDPWSQQWDGFDAGGRSMFGLFSGFVMLIGGVMLVAGVILAIQLRKLDRS